MFLYVSVCFIVFLCAFLCVFGVFVCVFCVFFVCFCMFLVFSRAKWPQSDPERVQATLNVRDPERLKCGKT